MTTLQEQLKARALEFLPCIGNESDWWAGLVPDGIEYDINVWRDEDDKTRVSAYLVVDGEPQTLNPIPLL